MVAVKLKKDPITTKQMVVSWFQLSKERTMELPEIPGERVYLAEKDVPPFFYRDCSIYYYDGGRLNPLYPESETVLQK